MFEDKNILFQIPDFRMLIYDLVNEDKQFLETFIDE